ncbi:MAG TPA: histidine phosphatase family protein [Balneolales bacterium]|nr:histidine phosphatase family protein [Balneolales bacterium]
MERTLLLMRHAKSDRSDPMLSDIDRPLNERGRNDAPLMGKFIFDVAGTPDQILSSTAQRARETAELVAAPCKYKQGIIMESSLYASTPGKYIQAISKVPKDVKTLLVVGHNPIMEQLSSMLCSGRPNEVSFRMPTASIACFIVEDRTWNTIELGMCELKWFITPKIINK